MKFAHGAIQWQSADAATTTYTVSGLSFQPRAIRFYWVGLGTGAGSPAENINERRGVGFGIDGSNRRCVGSFSQDTAATSNCGTVARNDAIAVTTDGAGATDGLLDLTAINSDGFVLTVDDAAPGNITVFWEAWGGTDITVAVIGDIAEPAGTGVADYTATGFTAGASDQVVMFAGVQSAQALNTGDAEASGLHIGYATIAAGSPTLVQQITLCGNADDASAAMDTDGHCFDGQCISMIPLAGAATIDASAVLTGWNTDGFRLNWTARALTNRRTIFMAIKGGEWDVGSLSFAGNTLNSTTTVSGLAYQPLGISLMGRMAALSSSTSAEANDRIGMGTGSSTSSRRSMGVLDEDATASSVCEIDVALAYDAILCYPSVGGNFQALYDLNAINADGFQIINDLAGGVATEWIGYLSFGTLPITGSGALVAQSATLAGAAVVVNPLDTYSQTPRLTVGAAQITGVGTPAAQSATTSGAGKLATSGTGAVAAQAATTVGSGYITTKGVGTPAAQAATTVGSGTVASNGTGTLTAAAASTSGAGVISSAVSGALAAQAATTSGVGKLGSTAIGALAASSAATAGAGLSRSVGIGTPAALAATTVGSGVAGSGIVGVLVAQAASLSGAGVIRSVGAGAPSAQAATVSGAGLSGSLGVGAIAAQAATASGVGTFGLSDVVPLDTYSQTPVLTVAVATINGVLVAQAATVAGVGISRSIGTGALAAQAATVLGAGISGTARVGSGAMAAQAATAAGTGLSGVVELDTYSRTPSLSVGTAVAAIGILSAQAASTSGSGTAVGGNITGSGTLAAQRATTSGAGFTDVVSLDSYSQTPAITVGGGDKTGTGTIAAQAAQMAGAGRVPVIGTGTLSGQSATVTGDGIIPAAAHPVGVLTRVDIFGGVRRTGSFATKGSSSGAADGVLAAQPASMSGAGVSRSVGTGSLAAQPATEAGTGGQGRYGPGVMSGQSATVSGQGNVVWVAFGALAAQAGSTTGAGKLGTSGSGALQASSASASGGSSTASSGTGTPNASVASVSGAGISQSIGRGTPAAQAATTNGAGAGLNSIAAGSATVVGRGIVRSIGIGALAANDASLVGFSEVQIDEPAVLLDSVQHHGVRIMQQYSNILIAKQRRSR